MGTHTIISPKIGVVVLVVLALLVYIYFHSLSLLKGPQLLVTEPENGSLIRSSLTTVEGIVKNVSHMSLNDRSIVFDEEGGFSEALLLSPGYNIIELTVEDRFGRERIQTLELVSEY